MIYKAAGFPFGGRKAVLIVDPRAVETQRLSKLRNGTSSHPGCRQALGERDQLGSNGPAQTRAKLPNADWPEERECSREKGDAGEMARVVHGSPQPLPEPAYLLAVVGFESDRQNPRDRYLFVGIA